MYARPRGDLPTALQPKPKPTGARVQLKFRTAGQLSHGTLISRTLRFVQVTHQTDLLASVINLLLNELRSPFVVARAQAHRRRVLHLLLVESVCRVEHGLRHTRRTPQIEVAPRRVLRRPRRAHVAFVDAQLFGRVARRRLLFHERLAVHVTHTDQVGQ